VSSGGDPIARIQQQLAAIGYSVAETGGMDAATKNALVAFQRRFRPQRVDGFADDETQMLLSALSRIV